jgi:hypothetical protein
MARILKLILVLINFSYFKIISSIKNGEDTQELNLDNIQKMFEENEYMLCESEFKYHKKQLPSYDQSNDKINENIRPTDTSFDVTTSKIK